MAPQLKQIYDWWIQQCQVSGTKASMVIVLNSLCINLNLQANNLHDKRWIIYIYLCKSVIQNIGLIFNSIHGLLCEKYVKFYNDWKQKSYMGLIVGIASLWKIIHLLYGPFIYRRALFSESKLIWFVSWGIAFRIPKKFWALR